MLNHDVFSFFNTFSSSSLSFSFVFLFLTILPTAFGLVCYASCPINSSSSSLVLKVAFMCSNERPREGEMS